jgi:hypothetical protein
VRNLTKVKGLFSYKKGEVPMAVDRAEGYDKLIRLAERGTENGRKYDDTK